MDAYDRIVYRALGVPDVLSEESQLRAAGSLLLKSAWQGIMGTAVLSDQEQEPYRALASRCVAKTAELLRGHRLDPLIGGFGPLDISPDLYQSSEGASILDERQRGVLVGQMVAILTNWLFQNPDALHNYS